MRSKILCAMALTLAVCAFGVPCAWADDAVSAAASSASAATSSSSAAAVADDTYTPATFGWTGGSGRLKGIECTSVEVKDGVAMATLVFQSANSETVRLDGVEYENTTPGTQVGTFVVPIPLDRVVSIEGLTTAMSQPHWIEYALYCSLEEPADETMSAEAILERYSTLKTQVDKVLNAQKTATTVVISKLLSGNQNATGAYEPAAFSLEGVKLVQSDAAPAIDGLTYVSSLDLEHAKKFSVHYYDGGYKLLDLTDSGMFLVVPEGAEPPAGLDKGIAVLRQPLDRVYQCATASMGLIDAIGALGAVALTGTDVSGWEIEAPRKALQSGTMRFAGKYNAPDYEMLIANNCDVAIESTMILHNPEVKEMIEQLGVPVLIDLASYEAEPLGRLEWVKLYGALFNRELIAQEFFDNEMTLVNDIASNEPTGKTIAFFAVKSDGSVTIRTPGDYMSRCITLAGGTYAFSDLAYNGTASTINITMEQFYNIASKADYLVYNGTIQQPINSVDDLLALSETFADYKAVKEGHVYSTTRDLYQSTDRIAEVIRDFHTLVTDSGDSLTFLNKVD